jgi:hypothetical protein
MAASYPPLPTLFAPVAAAILRALSSAKPVHEGERAVAFLSIHTMEGDPDDLLARKQQHMDPVVERLAPQYGAIASVTSSTATGIITVNLWETAEGAADFSQNAEALAAQQASGLPRPATFERFADARYIFYSLGTTQHMTSPDAGLPGNMGAPATRALTAAGYTQLSQLSNVPAAELKKLHGVGPKALRLLQEALEERGMSLG